MIDPFFILIIFLIVIGSVGIFFWSKKSRIDEKQSEAIRDLERRIAEICRKVAREVVKKNRGISVEITVKNIHKYLGPPKYLDSEANKHDEVGVATGLAWTEVGGDIMNIETSLVRGKGSLILTGDEIGRAHV